MGAGNVPAGLGATPSNAHELPLTGFGWPIDPSGVTEVLLDLHSPYNVPVFVAENRAAFDDIIDDHGPGPFHFPA